MNSTPAASKARRIARSFGVVIEVSPSRNSARRIVVTPTADSRAKSSALQRTSARAARIWALDSVFLLPIFILHGIFHTIGSGIAQKEINLAHLNHSMATYRMIRD